ncbi:MAG: hypothetical protein ACRD1V_10355 [Vicinamibacterales bacterium]
MSLLERLGRGHLSDRHVARLWTSGDRHPHLEECAECRARYDAFDQWVAGIGEELRAEADATMPLERYAAQQVQIARRLEILDRPGRVIAFPKAARAVINGHSHVRRWVTAAAAAGLLAGVGLGSIVPGLFDGNGGLRHAELTPPRFTAEQSTARMKTVKPKPMSVEDADFLSDSFGEPRVSDLRAIDDLTPHIRDMVPAPAGK